MTSSGSWYRKRLASLLLGKPVIQVRDLWIEAGLDRDRYAGHPMERYHYARLLEIGYLPIDIPTLSGIHSTQILVRGPWGPDASAGAINPKFLPYLEDGDPLMALLVYRAQRDSPAEEIG